jgi:nucleoside-diphosphate-sugar epimerase
MRILVTGASGFIGSNVAARLAADGHTVRALLRRTSSSANLSGASAELAFGDVEDAASLKAAMTGVQIVVHVAGLASDWGPYESFHRVNVRGTQNVARAALAGGVSRMVHISTTALHGFPGFRHATESTPFAETIWPYCQTKRMAEEWLAAFASESGLDVAVVRPGNVFGRNDRTFFARYAEGLFRGQVQHIDGGASWTCPSYVENLVDGILLACFEPAASGETFIITDGLDISWHTFAAKVATALGARQPRFSLPYAVAYAAAGAMEAVHVALQRSAPPLLTRYRISNAGRDYHFSIEKARQVLGYHPRVDLDTAIERSARWYLDQRR